MKKQERGAAARRIARNARSVAALMVGISAIAISAPAMAQDAEVLDRLEALEQRLNALEAENARLRAELDGERGAVETGAEAQIADGSAAVPDAAAQDQVPGDPAAPVQLAASGSGVVTETDDPREMDVADRRTSSAPTAPMPIRCWTMRRM